MNYRARNYFWWNFFWKSSFEVLPNRWIIFRQNWVSRNYSFIQFFNKKSALQLLHWNPMDAAYNDLKFRTSECMFGIHLMCYIVVNGASDFSDTQCNTLSVSFNLCDPTVFMWQDHSVAYDSQFASSMSPCQCHQPVVCINHALRFTKKKMKVGKLRRVRFKSLCLCSIFAFLYWLGCLFKLTLPAN